MGGFARYLRVRITSAEPDKILTKLSFSDFVLQDIRQVDLLTVELKIKQTQWRDIQKVLEMSGASGQVLEKHGFLWSALAILKRPVLVAGIILFGVMACIAPGRIFVVEVYGNEQVCKQEILDEAENCGVIFGVKAATIRSEAIKNELLEKFPQLQWVGITTSGCVARIWVEERSVNANLQPDDRGVTSILALRDGIISQMTVYQGNAMVGIGQTVRKGDLLVSGYTDCGIKLRAEEAQAEIFAYTLRQNSVISPMPETVRGEYFRKHTCYRLCIGKKVIKLCNHSGIHTTSCVKMYSEDYWNLPGGFRLPVSVIKVDYLVYEMGVYSPDAMQDFSWMADYIRSYLRDQMISGQILTEDLQWDVADGSCVLTGSFACNEMIGKVKYEEILMPNAEDN